MSFFYSLFRMKKDGTGAEAKLPITFHEDLEVTGNTTLTGTLGVTGATTVDDLTATGTIILAGITISSNAGTPEAAVTGNAKGDLCMDTATGNRYTFKGTPTENTGWKLVTVAE